MIKVRRTGICGSDLHLTDSRTEPQTLPSGHEVAGEIVELPAGETRLKVGDRVALETIGAGLCCGDCFYCNDGQFKHCVNLAGDTGGGFAEYMTRRPTGYSRSTTASIGSMPPWSNPWPCRFMPSAIVESPRAAQSQ